MSDDEAIDKMMMQLVSDCEQDKAECRSWWNDTPMEVKLGVFRSISRMCNGGNVGGENMRRVIGRFAQLAFVRAVTEYGIAGDVDQPNRAPDTP